MGRTCETLKSLFKKQAKPPMDYHFGYFDLVVQDAAAYQRLRQLAEDARVLEGIRQGIEDMNAGRTVSLDEFKEHTGTKHGIRK